MLSEIAKSSVFRLSRIFFGDAWLMQKGVRRINSTILIYFIVLAQFRSRCVNSFSTSTCLYSCLSCVKKNQDYITVDVYFCFYKKLSFL